MKNIIFLTLCAVAVHYSMSATVPSTDIYNCESGQTGNKIISCGMCGAGRIPSADRLKCYTCPTYCAKGKCTLKSSITDENDATECSECIEHYYLTNKKCSECITGCKNCTDATTCNTCYTTHAYKSTDKTCQSCPSQCKTCSWSETNSKTECSACNDRYVVNTDKGCTSCGSLCKSCTFANNAVSCSTCDETAYKDTTTATATCKTCSNSNLGTGCRKCSDKDTCTECVSKAYMLLTSGSVKKCDPCSGIHSQCSECSDSKCTKCKAGYYLKSDSCSPCPRNCDECSETDSIVKCTKCKVYYTEVNLKSCDRCPDNCRQCKVSGNTLICEICNDKYAKNSNNLCSKCPDNCNACTWSSANSRTECNGNDASHSCVENDNGKSWGRKSDGTCVACPGNCLKCYFKSTSDSTPVCYASKCAKGYGFDDVAGTCFACSAGCDYCKKTSTGSECQKCSEKYAPKYNTAQTKIDSCMSCASLNDCEYCEVVGDAVKCRRSGCASGGSGTNKKFSFSSKDCSGNCPSNGACSAASKVHDENEICYCRDCPAGSAVILAGNNAGMCKSCGADCESCGLTTNKEDVECKTCKGTKQWVTVEISGTNTIGCYDCSGALSRCKVLEYTGGVCKCKTCLGDNSHTTPTVKATFFQESSGQNKCLGCEDSFPNALWCAGTAAAITLDTCQYGYVKSPSNTCLKIPTRCANYGDTESAPNSGKVACTQCSTGSYLSSGDCPACPSGCTACIDDSGVKCTECDSPTKEGIDCGTRPACTATTIPNCATPWTSPITPAACVCAKCTGPNVLVSTTGLGASCAGAASSAVGNCDIQANIPTDGCFKCASTHVLKGDKSTCIAVGSISTCKPGYNIVATDPSPADASACREPNTNHMPAADIFTTPVAVPAPQQTPNCAGFLGFSATAGDARCAGCPTGSIIEATSTVYTCRSCPAANTLDNCVSTVADGTACYCAKCSADSAPNYFVMKPDKSGCTQCSGITNCNAYTLRLNNGAYECACSSCTSGTLSADGKNCVDCSGTTCSGGSVVVSTGTTCTCQCGTNQIKKSDNSGCVNCAAPTILNCASGNFALDSSSNCNCNKCNDGFVLKSDKRECLSCTATTPGGITPNCKTCTESGSTPGNIDVCQKCDDNFALNPGTSPTVPACMACQTGCKTCTVDTSATPATTVKKCTVCNSGYVLNNEGTCIQCPQSPAICSECRINPSDNTQALCLQFGCSGTSSLRDSDFKCESCSIANCKKCVKDIAGAVKCLKCNDAHYMDSSGNCQGCVSNCAFCVDGTTCIPNGCKEGFIRHRVDGNCITCTGTGVARCIYESAESDNLIPKICKSGYKLNTGVTPNVCEQCDPNCKSCETNGKDKCDSGQCNSGYFYDSTDQKCYQNKNSCAVSTRSNGQTICQSCDTTKSVLASGDCKPCGTGCTGCSFDSATSAVACTSCAGGYFKKDTTCEKCPTGCSTCTSASECTACMATYGLKDKLCVACGVSECQTCEVPSGGNALECKTCSNTFYLNTDDCGECPKFCKKCSYNNKYECTECNARYAKASDGTCVACPSNCETCTANADKTTRCTKCISNAFSLQTDGTCKTCAEAAFANCATCGPTPSGGKAKCDSCLGGFTLQDDKLSCLTCSITGCGMCAHGRLCTKCKKGFYLHNYNRECARKCYACTGTQTDCGGDISKTKNATDKIKFIDCGAGDCWAYRTENGNAVTFTRGCSNETCTSSYDNENCKTVDGKKECKKCCRGEKCNHWELDGSAGVAGLVAASLLVAICSILSLLWK